MTERRRIVYRNSTRPQHRRVILTFDASREVLHAVVDSGYTKADGAFQTKRDMVWGADSRVPEEWPAIVKRAAAYLLHGNEPPKRKEPRSCKSGS
jgi:hypothetical protein